mgnify:CR=1 FL=1
MPIKFKPITHKELWFLKKFGLRTLIKPRDTMPLQFASGSDPENDDGEYREDKALVLVWPEEYAHFSYAEKDEIARFCNRLNLKFSKLRSNENGWVIVCQ